MMRCQPSTLVLRGSFGVVVVWVVIGMLVVAASWRMTMYRPVLVSQGNPTNLANDQWRVRELRERISQLEKQLEEQINANPQGDNKNSNNNNNNNNNVDANDDNNHYDDSISPNDNSDNTENIGSMLEAFRKTELRGHLRTLSELRSQSLKTLKELTSTEHEVWRLFQQKQLWEKGQLERRKSRQQMPKNYTSVDEFQARQWRVQQRCTSGQKEVPGAVRKIFTDEKSGVLYCIVPKAGCTFWKRMFFLAEDRASGQTDRNAFDLSRNRIHSRRGWNGKEFNSSIHSVENYPTRLLVARDPFSRLLSSYLDKIYLPGFWPTEGVRGVRWLKKLQEAGKIAADDSGDFLRHHFDALAGVRDFELPIIKNRIQNSTREDIKCAKYVTFHQFLRALMYRKEPHWQPIHEICNPCNMTVTHISRMGTFTPDARVVLDKMGLGDVLDDMDNDEQVDLELEMIVNYNFFRIHHEVPRERRFFDACVTNREVAFRLWQNFQWRGYIDPYVTYSLPKVTDEEGVKADLLDQIWRARVSGLQSRDRMRATKENFFKKAFQSIPLNLFNELASKHALDIELFGFERERDEVMSLYNQTLP